MEEEEEFVEIEESNEPMIFDSRSIPSTCMRLAAIKETQIKHQIEIRRTVEELRKVHAKQRLQRTRSAIIRRLAVAEIKGRSKEATFMEDLYKYDNDTDNRALQLLGNPNMENTMESNIIRTFGIRIVENAVESKIEGPLGMIIVADVSPDPAKIIIGGNVGVLFPINFLNKHQRVEVDFFVPMTRPFSALNDVTRRYYTLYVLGQSDETSAPYRAFAVNAREYVHKEWFVQSLEQVCRLKRKSRKQRVLEFAAKQIVAQADRLCTAPPKLWSQISKFLQLGAKVEHLCIMEGSSVVFDDVYFRFPEE